MGSLLLAVFLQPSLASPDILLGDLDRDGLLEVVATTTDSSVELYAFGATGAAFPGWPRPDWAGPDATR